MKAVLFSPLVVVALVLAPVLRGEVTLKCDFTSATSRGEPMHHHWNVSNRISPIRGFAMPVGERPRINIVRPLGGKAKDGRKLVEEDTLKWEGDRAVYDWQPLHTQIAKVRSRAVLHQLMIDNPPWVFLRGLDLGGGNGVETYGNAWPPNVPKAWARYIQAMMAELVRPRLRPLVQAEPRPLRLHRRLVLPVLPPSRPDRPPARLQDRLRPHQGHPRVESRCHAGDPRVRVDRAHEQGGQQLRQRAAGSPGGLHRDARQDDV